MFLAEILATKYINSRASLTFSLCYYTSSNVWLEHLCIKEFQQNRTIAFYLKASINKHPCHFYLLFLFFFFFINTVGFKAKIAYGAV